MVRSCCHQLNRSPTLAPRNCYRAVAPRLAGRSRTACGTTKAVCPDHDRDRTAQRGRTRIGRVPSLDGLAASATLAAIALQIVSTKATGWTAAGCIGIAARGRAVRAVGAEYI